MTTLLLGTGSVLIALFMFVILAISAISMLVVFMVSSRRNDSGEEEQHLLLEQGPTETSESTNAMPLQQSFFNLFDEGQHLTEPVPGKFRRIATFRMEPGIFLTICKGSVVDFESPNGVIVNATNKQGLGGGGVDGAISQAGGQSLADDRAALPVNDGNRLDISEAILLGPKQYGDLKVPYVALTCGPDFREKRGSVVNTLLGDCYDNVLAATHGHDDIEQVAFCFISAGAFRGENTLDKLAEQAIISIYYWASESKRLELDTKVRDVVLFVYKKRELEAVMKWADDLLCACMKAHP